MSIWTCDLRRLGLSALFALAGCADGTGAGLTGLGATGAAPQTVAVAQGAVVIGGPPGYCIDRPGSRLAGDAAFVLLGSCAAITRDASARTPNRHGLLTASVTRAAGDGPGLLADPTALERFLTSPAGRGAMARNGQSASVEILEVQRDADAMLIRLSDSSQDNIPGMDPTYWRGLTDVNGRLVTVSVISFADQPLTRDDGLVTLRAFLARIRAETAR